jgi:hypothetical protein
MPEESQKRVEAMSAITIVTPDVKAERNWSPTSSALAMSISADSGMTTGSAGRCR